jgi:hypothetical protein
MSKKRICWTEIATYEVIVETPLSCDELENGTSGDGEGRWFEVVEAQRPDWPTKSLVSVNERDLRTIEEIES